MQYRIVWVHGIGTQSSGYSNGWRDAFNAYLQLPADAFVEVCWNTVFDAGAATRGEDAQVELTPQEQQAEADVRADLEVILQARAATQQQAEAEATRGEGRIIERSADDETTRGAFDWLFNPDEYIGDFAKYLAVPRIRAAIKEKAKEQLRPLVGYDYGISIVAHSWGTVVSYEALLDLEVELPLLRTVNLFTLGSPLWMVRPLLQDRSGRKPRQLTRWVNVHARGDLVGAWLQPGFTVDNEFEVPNFGGAGAHSSYFVQNNEAVQRTIVGRYIKG